MKTIYEPQGKAREYSALALNVYNNCKHGCAYCFAARISRKTPREFAQNIKGRELFRDLEKDAPAYRGREVLLCFMSDPYQPFEESGNYTGRALEILVRHGVRPVILTKSGGLATRDFELLRCGSGRYGATLTMDNAADSQEFEPGAAFPDERMRTLEAAHAYGIPTWVSMEPVIDPAQTLNLIRETAGFVDLYKVGRWNYDKRANAIDWKAFGEEAVALLTALGKPYYVKHDLALAMGRKAGFHG